MIPAALPGATISLQQLEASQPPPGFGTPTDEPGLPSV